MGVESPGQQLGGEATVHSTASKCREWIVSLSMLGGKMPSTKYGWVRWRRGDCRVLTARAGRVCDTIWVCGLECKGKERRER